MAARAFDADVTYASGKAVLGYFTILHDSVTRRFLWNYYELPQSSRASGRRQHVDLPDEFAPGWTPFVTDQRILLYRSGLTSVIFWESTPDQVGTLDEAETKMLIEARAELRKWERSRFKPTVGVGLREALGREFFLKPWDSNSRKLDILSIAQLPNGNLELIVRAYWTEKVVLDARLKLLSHEKLP